VREKERVSKAVRKERKKILVDHFFLPILVDKKKRNKKASVLWRTNTTRKRILVRQKRRLCALAPIEPRSRPMSIGREPSSSREEEQRSLFTLSPSLFRARNTNTITTTTRKSTIPDRFSSTSSLLIQEAKEKEKERGERGTRGRRKVFGAHQADPGEGHGLFCVR
tara:strand:- start:269 stop:766 length:498 start_codon:yes stop_codon:yes gene_type:complete